VGRFLSGHGGRGQRRPHRVGWAHPGELRVLLDDGSVYDWGPPTDVVTEDLLRDVFGIEAAVHYTPDPEIIPKHSP